MEENLASIEKLEVNFYSSTLIRLIHHLRAFLFHYFFIKLQPLIYLSILYFIFFKTYIKRKGYIIVVSLMLILF